MSRIISIGTAVPAFCSHQSDILQYMIKAYNNPVDTRKLNILFKNSGIETRYSVLPDFNPANEDRTFFSIDENATNIEKRMHLFKAQSKELSLAAVRKAFDHIGVKCLDFGITHLITVSCTGLFSPGLDIELIESLHLPYDIFHTSVNFMGCNAAFHALKLADMIVDTEKDAKVLIVCVELCTLHFQPKSSNDCLLSNTIFGDGAAAVILTSDFFAQKNLYKGFSIKSFYSTIIKKGKPLMAWDITPIAFEMVLDAEIPNLLGDEINSVINNALKKSNNESIDLWAIHPGGKKILDTLQNRLSLSVEELHYSYQVLKRYGNMSSPTILFVLKEMESQGNFYKNIFSIGFGPGLSIEAAILTYVQ